MIKNYLKRNTNNFQKSVSKFFYSTTMLMAFAMFTFPSSMANAQVNALFNFENGLEGWSSSGGAGAFYQSTIQSCDGGSIFANVYYGMSTNLLSQSLGQSSGAAVNMSFDYKIVNYESYTAASPSEMKIVMQWSNSITGPYTTFYTIESADHIASASCVTKSTSFTPGAGPVYVKIISTALGGGSDLYYFYDKISFTEGAPASCLAPTALVVPEASISENSLAFSWTAPTDAPALGYEYEVRTSGLAGSGATGLVASEAVAAGVTTATATGLSSSTFYKIYLRSICAAANASLWIQSPEVATQCGAASIPYILPFAATTTPNLPLCVTRENLNNDDKLWKTTNSPTGMQAPSMQYIYSITQAANDWFYTAPLNLTAGTTYRLLYKYKITSFEEKLKVALGSSPQATSMTQVLSDITIPASTSNVVQQQVDFTVTTSGVYYVGFQAKSDANKNALYVGEISVILGPNCFAPTGVINTNLTKVSTTIAWEAPTPAPANGYSYELRTSGAAGSGATGLAVSGNTAAGITTAEITGLTADTTYNLYVRSNCGTADQSIWTAAVTFMTLCDFLEIEAVNDTTCVGSTANLAVTGATTEVSWYATATSTEVLATGPIFETPVLLENTSYYAIAMVGTCLAPSRTEVIATVNEVPVITGNNVQTVAADVAEDATLADLLPFGENVMWFATEADATAFTNELEIGTQLNSGTTYYAVLTENDCRSLPFPVLVTVTLGLENQTMIGLSFYPNPVQNQLNINYTANITSISIFNLVGQKVMNVTPNTSNVVLDMSTLASGSYMIQVNADAASKVIKLIKK